MIPLTPTDVRPALQAKLAEVTSCVRELRDVERPHPEDGRAGDRRQTMGYRARHLSDGREIRGEPTGDRLRHLVRSVVGQPH